MLNHAPSDVLHTIMEFLTVRDALACRAVNWELRAVADAGLRRLFEADALRFFALLRMRFDGNTVPMRLLLKHAFFPGIEIKQFPRYECGRCRQKIEQVGECRSCMTDPASRSMQHRRAVCIQAERVASAVRTVWTVLDRAADTLMEARIL